MDMISLNCLVLLYKELKMDFFEKFFGLKFGCLRIIFKLLLDILLISGNKLKVFKC